MSVMNPTGDESIWADDSRPDIDLPLAWFNADAGVQEIGTATNAVRHDRWDREDLDFMSEEMPDLAKAMQRMGEVTPTGDKIVEDFWLSILKAAPELETPEDMDPAHLVNRYIQSQIRELPQWRELRRNTQGDLLLTTMATLASQDTMRDVATATADIQTQIDDLPIEERETTKEELERQRKIQEGIENGDIEVEHVDGPPPDGGCGPQPTEPPDPNRPLPEKITVYSEPPEPSAGGGQPSDDVAPPSGQAPPTVTTPDGKTGHVPGLDPAAVEQLLQQQTEHINQQLQDIQGQLDGKIGPVRQQLGEALAEAAQDAQDMNTMSVMMGTEPGQAKRMPIEDRLKLAKKLQEQGERIREICKMFGSIREFQKALKRNNVRYVPEEIHDVEMGRDIEHLFPSELAKFHDPVRRPEFLRGYVEGDLLQYQMRGTEERGKGGIVWLQDASGSMSGPKDILATALGMNFLHQAKEEKRSFLAVHFGSKGETRVIEFLKPEDYTPERIMGFIEMFWGGGTDFMTPLSLGLERLQSDFDDGERINGDIVLCTDGGAAVDQKWWDDFAKERERLDFTLHGIQIGPEYNGFRGPSLRDMTGDENFHTVADLVTPHDVGGVLRDV